MAEVRESRPVFYSYHLWLLLLAILFAIVFTCAAFDWLIHPEHPFGWLGLAVTFGLASRLP